MDFNESIIQNASVPGMPGTTGEDNRLICEQLMSQVYNLYASREKGFLNIIHQLQLPEMGVPKKRINVLIVGNHSAGKSSFVNWYLEEYILKAGVAIETQGFTFITHGKRRTTLSGKGTSHVFPFITEYPHLRELDNHLTTEISTSRSNKFQMVNFIDTPGLVDGDMKYPFRIEEFIDFLSDYADLILVFFDPIGQALCRRTMRVIGQLAKNHTSRLKFFLSKADEAGNEADRQKILISCAKELSKIPQLYEVALDIPTIFIPTLQEKRTQVLNQLDGVIDLIDVNIGSNVQRMLNKMETDTNYVYNEIDKIIKREESFLPFRYAHAMLHWTMKFLIFFTLIINAIRFIPSDYHLFKIENSIFNRCIIRSYGDALIILKITFAIFCVIMTSNLLKKKLYLEDNRRKLLYEKREEMECQIFPKAKEYYQHFLSSVKYEENFQTE
ncbi:hypothetical protein SNEBB_010151 [Seison nebaliae]|nr:hypothetical protein SNEBB_010151 [Seison nebaliae]